MNHQSQSVVSWGKTLYQLIVHTLNTHYINFSDQNCLTSITWNALKGETGPDGQNILRDKSLASIYNGVSHRRSVKH